MIERKPYAPREWQPPITAHILAHERCAVWATMGTGKTAPTLTALDGLFLAGEDHPALIVGPLRVARKVWPDEALKWDHLRQISVSPVVGDQFDRLMAVKRDTSIHTINYENLGWLREYWGDRWPYRIVVSDESTRLKNYRGSFQTSSRGTEFLRNNGSKRARFLAQVAWSRVTRFVELTGTPAPNGLKDLWGQMWFVDAGERLGRTHQAFARRWFQNSRDGYGLQPLPFAAEQIHDRLRDLCLTVDIADYVDVAKPIIVPVYVDLPHRARIKYNEMEKQMFTELEGHEVEAFGAAARTNKCLQLASGAAYVGDPDAAGPRPWVVVHEAKMEALRSCVEESAGAPQIVVYEFKSDAARILKEFGDRAVMLSEPRGFDAFMTGKKEIGLAHPASMGHGVNDLEDVTNVITFFSHNWDLELYDQIVGRIGPVRQMQKGHKRPVFIRNIIARDTVDEDVMHRRESKRPVQEVLMDAMKRRR